MDNSDRIVIAGVGALPVGEHWDIGLRGLASRAIRSALAQSSGLQAKAVYVGNVFASILSHQANLGALICDESGLHGIEANSFEAGGASSGAALQAACRAVKSGFVDVAAAVGVEKITETTGTRTAEVQNMLLNYEYEAMAGLTLPAGAALIAQRYLEEYQLDRDVLDSLSLTAYAQAACNPDAFYHLNLNEDKLRKQTLSHPPLGMYDCAALADGAAAVVVTRSSLLPESIKPVYVAGSGFAIEPLSLHDRHDLLNYGAAGSAARKALNQAGISTEQVDLWELWDAFSIDAILAREAIGLSERGEGWKADGRYYSSMGGCLGRGNPLGASGLYQIVEAVHQLRGEAGKCQINDVRTAFVQSIGGLGASASAHILTTE